MPTACTIHSCGTGYNRNCNDIVARLDRETLSGRFVTDGPGRQGQALPARAAPPSSTTRNSTRSASCAATH
jgi:hypothetical protein